jgi:hypothetical protein
MGGDDSQVVSGQKFPGEKRKYEMVRCCDETASSFVTEVWGAVFSHFHCHRKTSSIIQN